ncbi:MAG TPA: exodeoxyribonuclease VII small subunit [Solirubrobacteraceae bacterium]
MSDTNQSQAIVFEPTEELELRAERGVGGREGGRSNERVASGEPDATQSRQAGSRAREPITFEQGYEELKRIVARLDDPELPIHEMFEGFRRGKGLEKTLRAYLQEHEGEIAELEAGENLAEFEIVAPSRGAISG